MIPFIMRGSVFIIFLNTRTLQDGLKVTLFEGQRKYKLNKLDLNKTQIMQLIVFLLYFLLQYMLQGGGPKDQPPTKCLIWAYVSIFIFVYLGKIAIALFAIQLVPKIFIEKMLVFLLAFIFTYGTSYGSANQTRLIIEAIFPQFFKNQTVFVMTKNQLQQISQAVDSNAQIESFKNKSLQLQAKKKTDQVAFIRRLFYFVANTCMMGSILVYNQFNILQVCFFLFIGQAIINDFIQIAIFKLAVSPQKKWIWLISLLMTITFCVLTFSRKTSEK